MRTASQRISWCTPRSRTVAPEPGIRINPSPSRNAPLRLYRQNHSRRSRSCGDVLGSRPIIRGCNHESLAVRGFEDRARRPALIKCGVDNEETSADDPQDRAVAQVAPVLRHSAGEGLPEFFLTLAKRVHCGHKRLVSCIRRFESVPLLFRCKGVEPPDLFRSSYRGECDIRMRASPRRADGSKLPLILVVSLVGSGPQLLANDQQELRDCFLCVH